jgi:dipeptidyl aminopeptidase/acylaminoacyl peptidase
MYAAPGYLLFVRQGTLMAQAFDADALETTGQPFSVGGQVGVSVSARAAFSVSDAGVLTTASGDAGALSRFAWFDRTGRPLEVPTSEVGPYRNFDLSPDERQIAVSRAGDIWLLDVARGLLSRFTSDPTLEGDPVWSSDSRRLVYTSSRSGQTDLFEKPIGGGAETLLVASDEPKYPEDWSSDGRYIIYLSPIGGRRFWALPMVDDRRPFIIVDTPFAKDEPHFSSDGRWLAYYSDESGRAEVYVQPFPGPGERVRVSTDGGSQPRWKKDGTELFYLSLDGKFMSAAMRYQPALQVDVPRVLFQTPITDATPNLDQYDVTADGQRFVVLAPVEGDTQSPITVVLNWTAGLKN